MIYLLFMFTAVIITLIAQLAFDPGEGVVFSILGAVCAIIFLVLAVIAVNMQKQLNTSG